MAQDSESVLQRLLLPAPTRIMGIVNVTPDSFSDGGRWFDAGAAVEHGIELMEEGADLIDVGGESTRPGALRVEPDDELSRILPVVSGLVAARVPVSVDTMSAAVAERAIDAGAVIVNDVSGGLADPRMLDVAASTTAGYVIMHWRGFLGDTDARATYRDVVADVNTELTARVRAAMEAGVDPERIIIDPGIGFSKTPVHNWTLLRAARSLERHAFPVLWGVSRKRFLAEAYSHDTMPYERDAAAIALTTLLASQRVWAVRTHVVAPHRAAINVVEKMRGQ